MLKNLVAYTLCLGGQLENTSHLQSFVMNINAQC